MKRFWNVPMAVPEVWRHDGTRLEMRSLDADNDQPLASSRCLPGLTAAMIDSLLASRFEQGETALIREFRGRIEGELYPTQRERTNRS